MTSIERYLNVRSAYGASFSPAGDLAFLLDATGTPQVWSLAEPGLWPNQRTFFDERVTFASVSPEREELIFGMDEGGNERAQLFLLAADGEIQPLTDRPDAKHRWGGWSHDGERFAFAANRRDRSVFDIYTQGRTETGDATRVHEGDGWLTISGFSPSDDRLLVSESQSSFDQDLYTLDLDSRTLEHVTPHEGAVRFLNPTWSPAGDALYVVTDHDSDTLSLVRLDLATHDIEAIADGDGWNVEGFALDTDTGRIVYARNVDGYTDLTVGRLADGGSGVEEFPAPDLPDGVAGGIDFDADAERFAVTVTGPRENTNVHVVDVETGESERWTNASRAGLARESFHTPELIRYDSFDGRAIPAFFSLPADAREGETPVVVDIHGGPEGQRRPSFSPVTQYLCEAGYAVFEPNVRGSTGYGKSYTHLDDKDKRMDSVADIERGVAWLHDHPMVDPERIAVMGGSYGGFMTLASLTEYPDLWAAGVDIVGIADFTTFLENTGSWRRALREAEYGSLENDRELLESISPLNNIERIDAPLFVLHGANDPRVPVGEAEQVAARVGERDVPVETLIFDDEGHGIVKRDNRIEAYTAITDFLDEYV